MASLIVAYCSASSIISAYTIDCHNMDSRTPTPSFTKVGVFNARSVGSKSTSVLGWIADNSFHLAANVETWHDGSDMQSEPRRLHTTRLPPRRAYCASWRLRFDRRIGTNHHHGGACLVYTITCQSNIVFFKIICLLQIVFNMSHGLSKLFLAQIVPN